MKNLKILMITMSVMSIMVLISCGDDSGNGDDPQPTQKELVIEALGGTWSINATSSSFGNAPIDAASVTVSFTETGFAFTGEITEYISGGTFIIGDEGAIGNVEVNLASEELEVENNPSISLNGDRNQITISFNTVEASTGRVSGIGTYTIVFSKS